MANVVLDVVAAEFIARLIAQFKQASGFLGLIFCEPESESELTLTAVCASRRIADFARELPSLLSCCGPLAGHMHTPLPSGGTEYTLLYTQPPRLVMLTLLSDALFSGLYPEDQVMWEWNHSLSAVPNRVPNVAVLLQKIESQFWVQLYRATLLARHGSLQESVALCANLRDKLILPLLSCLNGRPYGSMTYRAGAYAPQVAAAHPNLHRESILDALEAARQIYFALRYELADADFLRSEEAELMATELLTVDC